MPQQQAQPQEKEVNLQTEFLKYPCPKCGRYYLPYMHDRDRRAFMICPEHGQFRTSVAVSANFRKFCSKVGSAPNRSPTYYTSSEQRVRRFLLNHGLIEGLDFFHNARLGPFVNGNGRKVYYWADFVVPSKKLVIEANPSIWHRMWNREEADQRKIKHLLELGWEPIGLDEKDLNQLNKKRTEGKVLGKNPKNKPYHRTENCKRMDHLFECSKEDIS